MGREMQGTGEGNAFWRRTAKENWGRTNVERVEGEAAFFDKDDLVEAVYSRDGLWYTGAIVKYVGDGYWIVFWIDDMPEENPRDWPRASTVRTGDIRHTKPR